MGLNFRWLVNAGLLILPVGTTVGVLMGVDSHRQTTGQEPLFNTPSSGPGTGGGTGNPSDDRITTEVHCEKQTGRIAPTRGVQYIRKFCAGFVLRGLGDAGSGRCTVYAFARWS
ncbi:hypothetical protein WAI453_013236 [Rhynchosporium graminicola]